MGEPARGINYERLYDYRFRRVPSTKRSEVWREIARYLFDVLGRPQRVLDCAAGRGEFIDAVPAEERWAIDMVAHPELVDAAGVKVVIGDLLEVDLPRDHFDGILLSNALEHFDSQETVGTILDRLRGVLQPGGRIAVLGPNFRYCSRQYFDCADHTIALTHVAVEEHLYAAGFDIERVIPRFLPYSFRGHLPQARGLVAAYLRLPLAWRLLGKQFLVVARRPSGEIT